MRLFAPAGDDAGAKDMNRTAGGEGLRLKSSAMVGGEMVRYVRSLSSMCHFLVKGNRLPDDVVKDCQLQSQAPSIRLAKAPLPPPRQTQADGLEAEQDDGAA